MWSKLHNKTQLYKAIKQKQAIYPRCCWKLGACAQQSSVKSILCEIFQKTWVMEFLFRKTLSPRDCNCTAKGTITDIFL